MNQIIHTCWQLVVKAWFTLIKTIKVSVITVGILHLEDLGDLEEMLEETDSFLILFN